jgi:serine/threonine-protein kinase
LTAGLKEALPVERLASWTNKQMLLNSRHLVRVYDLANFEGHFFVVREHMPLSLNDLLVEGSGMPVHLAAKLGYQVLEALGDLHLHMGADGQIRNIFHLDLRPSRILLGREKPRLKIYNGGLWKEVEKASPDRTALRELPISHLSYRAPEQFRTYLARKRPPIFTDIYLFGTLLYEMLTGTPAFKASSFEEYEIQHCEQYPTPPRVWRSEIPESLNELVMNCLACDPMKRFRSTTQISLALEKAFPAPLSRAGDELYRKYLTKLGI